MYPHIKLLIQSGRKIVIQTITKQEKELAITEELLVAIQGTEEADLEYLKSQAGSVKKYLESEFRKLSSSI